ncbi:MAG: hypothetical protein OXR64_12650 [Chloroflexota bacterium]|nr:hypothetical protein [Chloroflexota bacterium]MDE2920676.1 hypothetical protein [Chloroflexota bacterium]
MGNGLINRLLRALRLDASLYREVSAPDGDTRQAALVVLLTAVAAGAEGVWVSVSGAGLIAITHVAAWPVWAAGIWLVGARLKAPNGEASGFGQVARAIAFAQAPGVFFATSLVLFWISAPLWGTVRTLISVWVVIGTFLAIRETLGLSNGRTLGTLFGVGAAIAVLLGPVSVFATFWALFPRHSIGGIVATVSYGLFDFNLGLGLIRAVTRLVLPAAIELVV